MFRMPRVSARRTSTRRLRNSAQPPNPLCADLAVVSIRSSLPGAGTTRGINSAFCGAAQAGSTYNIQPYLSPVHIERHRCADQPLQQSERDHSNRRSGQRDFRECPWWRSSGRRAEHLPHSSRTFPKRRRWPTFEQSGFQQAQNEANSQQGPWQFAIGSNSGLGAGQAGFGDITTQQQQQLSAEQADAWLASRRPGSAWLASGPKRRPMALTGANADLSAGAQQAAIGPRAVEHPVSTVHCRAKPIRTRNSGSSHRSSRGTGSLSGVLGSTTTPGPSTLSQIGGLDWLASVGLGRRGPLGLTGI